MSVKSSSPPEKGHTEFISSQIPILQQSENILTRDYSLHATGCADGQNSHVHNNDLHVFSEMKSRISVLMEVNKELKRLLIASIGSDFQRHLEQIVHEKAELSCKLDTSLEQLTSSEEEVDDVSIKCDIWRSKFLASCLIIDELTQRKAEVYLKCKESEQALQYMIQEREQLSKILLLMMKHLCTAVEVNSSKFQGVKSEQANNPLTILDLGNSLKKMSQTLSYQATNEHTDSLEVHVCEPTVGEVLARKVLTQRFRKPEESNSLHLGGIKCFQMIIIRLFHFVVNVKEKF